MNLINEYADIQRKLINNHTEESLAYLRNRGLKAETIEFFGLGYKNQNIKTVFLPDIDNCITIPFYDLYNRIVAFFCRSIENNGVKKYIGTHNIPYIYEKSKMLYNLNNVLYKFYNRKVFVLEGQIDVMSLYQIGIKNAVAVLGNKISDIQQEILYRYFDVIYIVCDNDEAGNNLLKINKKLKNELKIYKIKINYPNCKDINDLLVNNIDIKKYLKQNLQILK